MKPGSVVVDMAAAQGGNVAGTDAGEVVHHRERRHDHRLHRPARPAARAGLAALRQNLVNLMKLLTPEKDGTLVLDLDDVVQRGITVVRDGESMWPPPPVQVSAAPAAEAARRGARRAGAKKMSPR